MIKFISSKSPKEGIISLADKISGYLNDGKKVLWLVSGGSNISVAVEVMNKVRLGVKKPNHLANLTITQTDERFGPVGHVDSNWQQLLDAGFKLEGVKTLPVLVGRPLEETTKYWSQALEKAFKDNDVCIGQFGIGADGHVAGILPNSPAVKETGLVASYSATNFTRITMTQSAFKYLTVSYVFAFGDSKREAVRNLRDEDIPILKQPAQILKRLDDVNFYTDCL